MDEKPPKKKRTPTQRRDAAHTAARPHVSKGKMTICLSDPAIVRLQAHAIGYHTSASALVEELVMAHLRRFSLHDRGEAEKGRGEVEASTEVVDAGEQTPKD